MLPTLKAQVATLNNQEKGNNMNNTIITASYNDAITINFTSDAWFNATAVAKQFGKEVFEWINQRETVEYITKLCEYVDGNSCFVQEFNEISDLDSTSAASRAKLLRLVKKTGLVITKQGSPENGGGSWFHPKLSIRFAQWLDVGFSIWCDMQIEKILHPIIQTNIPPNPEKKTKKALPGCLTLEQQDIIKAKVKSNVEHLPSNKQAGQIIKQWSAIKQKFGCSYKEIQVSDYLNVISLLERLPIEGEFIQKQEAVQAMATRTEYDSQRARESIAHLREAAKSSYDDSLYEAIMAEIATVESCIVSAWTHIDESLFRLKQSVCMLERWRIR